MHILLLKLFLKCKYNIKFHLKIYIKLDYEKSEFYTELDIVQTKVVSAILFLQILPSLRAQTLRHLLPELFYYVFNFFFFIFFAVILSLFRIIQ